MRRRKFDYKEEVTNPLIQEIYVAMLMSPVDIKAIDKVLEKLLFLCWDPGATACFRLLCMRISSVNPEYAYIWSQAFCNKWGAKRMLEMALTDAT